MTLATERQKFEEWFNEEMVLHVSASNETVVRLMWKAWQASRKLANRAAQPVGFRYRHNDTVSWLYNDWRWPDSVEAEQCQIEWLYTAPPAPAVPECFLTLLKHAGGLTMGNDWNNGTAAKHHRTKLCEAVDTCRAAMLAQPVSSGYKLPYNVREALTLALQAMEFMGDTLNNIDAVCTEDVEYVTPAFNAVRELLAAAPEGGNDHDTRR